MKAANNNALQNNRKDEEYPDLVDNYVLWRLFFVSRSAVGRLHDLELAAIDVTPEQSGALFLLARNKGKSTIAEMSDAWLRQRNSVSTLIDRMSKQGLVKKIKVPKQKDLEIEITPKGRELHDRVRKTSKVFDKAFIDLSEEDRKQLAQYLRLILSRSRRLLDENYGVR
jgi:DNA-binding MarR family transcriptional regulator